MTEGGRAGIWASVLYLSGWIFLAVVDPKLPDTPSLIVWIVLTVCVGVAVGEWWALGLALGVATILLTANAIEPCRETGDIECDLNVPALVLLYFTPVHAGILGVGILLRKVVRGDFASRGSSRPG